MWYDCRSEKGQKNRTLRYDEELCQGEQKMEYYESHRDMMQMSVATESRHSVCLPHFHNCIEITYVLDGAMDVLLNDQELTVHKGEVLLCSAFDIHSYRDSRYHHTIVVIIPPAMVPSVSKTLLSRAFEKPIVTDEDGQMRTMMEMFVLAGKGENEILIKGLSYALLGLAIERAGVTRARAGEQTQLIRDVLQYLEEHIAEPLSVESVAKAFGYSKSRFSHLFNDRLKCTLPAYVRQLRCQHAARMLKETELSVLDIAMRTGFDCPQTFYRAFKQCYGVTPMVYKQ